MTLTRRIGNGLAGPKSGDRQIGNGAETSREDPDLSTRLALTVPEAVKAVGISERHFRSMLPEIPHVRIGERVVIPVGPLEEWLRKRADAQSARADAVAEEILRAVEPEIDG